MSKRTNIHLTRYRFSGVSVEMGVDKIKALRLELGFYQQDSVLILIYFVNRYTSSDSDFEDDPTSSSTCASTANIHNQTEPQLLHGFRLGELYLDGDLDCESEHFL